jgi:hypothetical protein
VRRDNHRDFGQARTLRRTPALRAEVNAVPPLLVDRMNDDRLEDAVLPDVFSKFVQLGFGKLGAGIVRVFAQQVDGQHERHTVPRRRRGRCLCCFRQRDPVRWAASSKQVQLSGLGLDPRCKAHARIVPMVTA